jgi:hypothetical protein
VGCERGVHFYAAVYRRANRGCAHPGIAPARGKRPRRIENRG